MASVSTPPAGGQTAEPADLLDSGTQLGEGFWHVTVAPDCGEASGAYLMPRMASKREDLDEEDEGAWSHLTQEERDRLNLDRKVRRARRELRQYVTQNKLTTMVTLTFRCWDCACDPCACGAKASPPDRATVKDEVALFIPRLRYRLKCSFPYSYVIERGERGTQRLHVHLLLPHGLDLEHVRSAWTRGRVDIPDEGRYRSNTSVRENARRLARYVSKYVAKSLADDDEEWAHSYERAQGWNVRQVKRRLASAAEVVWFVEAMLARSGADAVRWTSSAVWDDYDGPPAFFACEVPP